jgi:hypothetical protein
MTATDLLALAILGGRLGEVSGIIGLLLLFVAGLMIWRRRPH